MFRILAFTVKPYESADSRYRILQYRAIAERDGIAIEHRSFMGPRYFRWQIRNTQLLLRLLLYPFLWVKRLWQIAFLAPKYDAVWVSREMSPLGPPVLEELLLRRAKRVILDVDDALHIADKESSRLIPRLLRDRKKFGRMAASCHAVVCGNEYLADYYRCFSGNVQIIPTVVDCDAYAAVHRTRSDVTRIGWIGTPLNKHHLEMLRPALSALAKERRFELVVVGLNENLEWNLPGVRYLKWNLKEELDFFSHFDIGIMPLEDSDFARGKCAFKLIQYWATGLPVVASPVGVNAKLVDSGWNGFLAHTQEEWQARLRLLIDNAAERHRLGENGRELVRQAYSLRAVWPAYSAILTNTHREALVCVA